MSAEEAGTPLSIEAVLAHGYREFADRNYAEGLGPTRSFQKRIDDPQGTRYFLNIRYWDFRAFNAGLERFDASLHCATDTGGLLHVTFEEETLEKTEARAEGLWHHAGSCYYERRGY